MPHAALNPPAPQAPPGQAWDRFPGYGQAPPNWPGAQQSYSAPAPALPPPNAYPAPNPQLNAAPNQGPNPYLYPNPQQTYGNPQQTAVLPGAPAQLGRKRRLPRWLLIGVPVLVVAITATVVVVLTTGNSLNPAVNKVVCNPGSLSSCLIAPPSGAGQDNSAWGQTVKVDVNAYASAYAESAAAKGQPTETSSLLATDGLSAVVHRSWSLGPNQIDLILLQFDSAQGARAWAADRTGEFLALDDGPQLSVPGDTHAKAYTTAAADSSGAFHARYATTVGKIDLEAHYTSQSALHEHEFDLWAGTEYASLQSAPAPAPAPSPSATSFEAATCPGSLTSCLMPPPAGGSPIPGFPTTYTNSSYANDFIVKADISGVVQRMQNDHVVAIDSESWQLNGFASNAQVVLVQTRTDDQAGDLTSYIGNSSAYTKSFSISGYPDADARYAAAPDSNGLDSGLINAHVGTIFMTLWVAFNGPFDTSTAQNWAAQQLNLLTKDTQNHWGFPIPQVTTPSLPAFTPTSCPVATLTGCVMAVPHNATGANGGNVQTVGVSALVNAVAPDRQSYEQTWLTGDGAKSVASRSWTASNGATANDFVVQFGSARQAQAATLQLSGDSTHGSQSCAVASLPDLECVVLPENDSTGVVPIRVVAWTGAYLVDLEVTQTDAADTADALSWAQTQLQLLTGGA